MFTVHRPRAFHAREGWLEKGGIVLLFGDIFVCTFSNLHFCCLAPKLRKSLLFSTQISSGWSLVLRLSSCGVRVHSSFLLDMFCFVLLRFVFKGKCRWSLGGADAFDASWRVGRESSSCNKLLLHLHLCFESKLRRGIDATSWTRIRTILSTDWGRKISTCYVILVLLIKIWIQKGLAIW